MGGHATVGSSGSLSSSVEAASSSRKGHSLCLLHPRGLQISWTLDQTGNPMCPRGPVATDGHRSSGYLVLRRIVDPVYLVKEDLVASMNKRWRPIVGCTQPERRSAPISSITIASTHDQSSRGRSHWSLAHGHVRETPALQGPLGTFGLPVQGHAKKRKPRRSMAPQAPGAPCGGTLSTLRVPGQTKESGSTHRVTWEPNPFISTKNVRREPYIPNGRGDGTHSFHPR